MGLVCSLGLPIRPPHSGSPERQRARLSDLETSIAHSGSTTSVPRMGYAIKFLELPQVVGPNKSVFWGEDLHGSSLVFFCSHQLDPFGECFSYCFTPQSLLRTTPRL